nr:hypothetical protein [Tanacetum cinerariifolium]
MWSHSFKWNLHKLHLWRWKAGTCCKCEGPLRGGFCLFCDLKDSFTKAYSFNDTSNNFNQLPQPQFENYLCKLCGNNLHDGYDCQQQFSFIYKQEPSYNQNYNGNYYPHDLPSCLCCNNYGGSHSTFQCQPMDQNNDSSGLDQIQSPQYPRIHHPFQADVEEVLHDREKFMQDTQTFLEKFNRFSFGFTLRVLTIAWERIDKIKYVLTKPEEILDLMYKLREDVQNIREELAEYIDSPIWNCLIFFYEEDEEYTIQYREYLEKSPDAVTTVLPNEEPEYSSSMGYEHSNTTSKTESDKIIKSGVEELVPILSENKVTSEDKKECDMPVSPICDDHSDIFSYSKNDDDISSDDDDFEDIEYVKASLPDLEIVNIVLREKLLSITRLISNIESLNDNPTPDCVLNSSVSIPIFEESDNSLSNNFSPEFETFCDHTEETKSGNTTTHADDSLPEYDSFCFEIKPDQDRLINVLKNDIPDDLRDPLLEEADLFLAYDNSTPSGDIRFLEELLIDNSIPFPNNESPDSDFDNPSFPLPPLEPPDAEFDFEPDAEEEIPVVMNEKDEFDDYFPFMFFIRIFMPYLICSKMFICFVSAESEDTIFDPGISV